jgi:Uma2 family endonuclease
LIEGVVFMAAALSAEFHGVPHADLMGWLWTYRAFTTGVLVADNSTVRLDLGNEPQPDACLYIQPSHGGRVKMSAEGYIEGGPELVAEIAGSSASIDLNQKLDAYRRNGVQEYIVYRTYDGEIDWFTLVAGDFEPLKPDNDGIYRSSAFPGLWLMGKALVSSDPNGLLASLQAGIASPEHANFVQRLAASAHRP